MAHIGIYGGSFNPIHWGHIGLAKWLIEHSSLDEIWFMVTPNNPLKSPHELAPQNERLEGVQQAIAGTKGLLASDFEFTLPQPSYTANTLRALSATYPEHQFNLIIGQDNWAIFTRWKEWDYIVENYPIWVYPRHTQPASSTVAFSNEPKCPALPASVVPKSIIFLKDAPYFDISSTEIRKNRNK